MSDLNDAPRDDPATYRQAEVAPQPRPVPHQEGPSHGRQLQQVEQQIAQFHEALSATRAHCDSIEAKVVSIGAKWKTAEHQKRLEVITAIVAAVAAVGAAAFAALAWRQAVDTDTRQISSDLLDRFDADEMWSARLTLERYYYLLSGDQIGPISLTELATKTAGYFKYFVYQRNTTHEELPNLITSFANDREKQNEFFRQVDQSRRRVKNFYEEIMLFSDKKLITEAVKEKVLDTRFSRNTARFLECFWLPVEVGQNAALYDTPTDKPDRECKTINWYRQNISGNEQLYCMRLC